MKVAFLFDDEPAFPPDYNNMKCFYISEEMVRRGIDVIWLSMRGAQIPKSREIAFASLRVPSHRIVSLIFGSFSAAIFCLVNSVRIVYIDAWFYSRSSPFRQLATIITLRVLRIRAVVDQRDPYLDFEVARGSVRQGTLRHRLLKVHERLTIYTCSLFLLPSKAYERLLTREGVPAAKVKGIFRGVDLHQFNPTVDGGPTRARLGLEGKFVVGWFGMMYPHRQVKEVLVPLALTIASLVPNGWMIMGGKGPLEREVREAAKREVGRHFDYVGPIDYSKLPMYLAACDLLLCPIGTGSRFARHSNWLKILEGLAVGVPILATRTESSSIDLADLKGIAWTGEDLADFQAGVLNSHENLQELSREARSQAQNLLEFGIERTIPSLVDQVVGAGESRRG